jgi:glucokinase
MVTTMSHFKNLNYYMTASAQEYAIGIDIGGTGTKFGVVDHRGNILSHGTISTKDYPVVEDFVDALYNALLPLIQSCGGIGVIKGIGVGAPNGNYYKGTIEYAANLAWRGIVPLADMITKKFGVPTALTNDANAAAIGEMTYGAAKGMKDFIVITLGTGVGSGIVANGLLILGHDGFAGELGHVIVQPGGRKHEGTGKYGCLETYTSATGVARTALEILEKEPNTTTLLRNYKASEIDSRIVYECAMKGDQVAQEVYRYTGQILGEAFSNFVMFTSPEAIILFGGLIKAGDLIFKPTIEHMEKNLLKQFQNKVKVIPSELREADAAILGASGLVWEMKN